MANMPVFLGFAVTAQVDERQRLSRIFISDVLPDGLAYGEGPCATGSLVSSDSNLRNAACLVELASYSFVGKWFLLEF